MNQVAYLFCTNADFFLKVLGLFTGFVAFALGLYQYRRAELWKRKEFLGKEMKEFFADSSTRNMLLMVDWYDRKIPFTEGSDRTTWPRVNRETLVDALAPHTICDYIGEGPDEVGETASPRWVRALIRDCHDQFFDQLERIDSFAEAKLFRREELKPFLEYWLQSMATSEGPSYDLRWRLALLAYIQFYKFRGTARLFKAVIDVDISVGSALWQSLRSSDTELAAKLEAACRTGD